MPIIKLHQIFLDRNNFATTGLHIPLYIDTSGIQFSRKRGFYSGTLYPSGISEKFSAIFPNGGNTFVVKESPEEILSLIEEAQKPVDKSL